MLITKDQMIEFFHSTPLATIDDLYDDLVYATTQFFIDNWDRVAAFMAQIDVESGGLKHREENLNYSAERLMVVFPRYFRGVDVNLYARKPELIANRVYANRMGNGNEQSGDGWRYRGRGLIQLTGKNNYAAFGKSMGMSAEETSDYMKTAEGAAMSAAWYWHTNGLNKLADRKQIDEISRLINAGPKGLLSSVHALDKRRASYHRAVQIFR